MSLNVHRLAFAVALCSSLAFAADGGSAPDAGASPAAPQNPKDIFGALLDAGSEAGPDNAAAKQTATQSTPMLKTTGGSLCKLVRAQDHKLVLEHRSKGSIMDCQEEVRAEVKAKVCKGVHERLEFFFSGEWNGIAMEPFMMRVWCPLKDPLQ